MLVLAGQTANFKVWYEDSITPANGYQDTGLAFAQAVLATCENDLAALSNLFGGIMPDPLTLPFQINLVPGGGGGSHPGCSSTAITRTISPNSDTVGVPLTMDAEVAEVFMATQAQGANWNCSYSNGEALSRVLPGVLYPTLRSRFNTGSAWLNSNSTNPQSGCNNTNPSRPDWVNNTEYNDTCFVSIGCGTLFLNYLAYQLNFSWQAIIAAGAPTLGQTAANLGVPNAFNNFAALLAQYFPPNQPAYLTDDDPFPLGRPSLYLRHNLADDGTFQMGPLDNSPDIIAKNNLVASPQATYSTPASINSDAESDDSVLTGQDNYIYLRVWNRGSDATNVSATVYWSPVATLVTPNLWNLVGSAQFADVPPRNLAVFPPLSFVQVSNPGITWPLANIPVEGHYCFVATVGNAVEPAPVPTTFNTWNDFVNYIYTHNNITWRNFNVVTNVPQPKGRFRGHVPLPFLISGAWDKAHTFAFETIAALPQGSRMALQVPHWLGHGFKPAHTEIEQHEDAKTDPRDKRRARIKLDPHRSQPLGQIELRAMTASPSHLLVHIPPDERDKIHEIAIRQLYEGREVGRITWRLLPALGTGGEHNE